MKVRVVYNNPTVVSLSVPPGRTPEEVAREYVARRATVASGNDKKQLYCATLLETQVDTPTPLLDLSKIVAPGAA